MRGADVTDTWQLRRSLSKCYAPSILLLVFGNASATVNPTPTNQLYPKKRLHPRRKFHPAYSSQSKKWLS